MASVGRRFDAAVDADLVARRTAVVAGVVFVVASIPKFAFYGWELDQFERFGLPLAPVLVVLAGVLELAGGIALARRRLVLPALALLAPTMVVAVVSSGLLQGDVVPSLTVAPALLVAMGVVGARAARRVVPA